MSKELLISHILEHVNGDNSKLDSKEYTTLLALCSFLNPATLQCNPALGTLANCCMLSERTMNVAIAGLVEKGFITYVKGGLHGTFRRANAYKISYDLIYSHVKTMQVVLEAPPNMVPAPPWR